MKQPLTNFGTDPVYKIYTTANDVDATSKSLWREMTPQQNVALNRQWHAYEDVVCEMRMTASWGWKATADTVIANSAFDLSRTAVSIMVAQPGPLCSQNATITYFLIELMTIFLEEIGVQYEILGLTTVDRKGGKSRQQWVKSGSPKNPGRLNDAKRIVIREASSTDYGTSYASQVILRSEMFNDSLDGEALFWAAERLKNLNADTNLVLMISDGAPSDAISIQENHPDFLLSHLKAVIQDLQATPGFSVAGIGIDRDVSDLYESNLKTGELEQLPAETLRFLTGLFS